MSLREANATRKQCNNISTIKNMQTEITINPILLTVFTLINIVSFFYVLIDKTKAENNYRRIPEINFFLWGICFGSIGILTGMYVFRHKIRKWYFVIGFSLLAVQNLTALYLLSEFL